MKSITSQNPCDTCNEDRQEGNPYSWQTPCHNCEKKMKWEIEQYKRIKEIEKILGDNYDLDRIRELVEAEKDGRCVVFPCKPSNVTVYQLRSKKHARGEGVSPRHVGCATVWAGGHYQLEHQGDEPCRGHDFGKTWFLSEESAKAALKGDQHG